MSYQQERPVGIAVISVLWWVGGGLTVLGGLAVLLIGATAGSLVGLVDGGAGGAIFVIFLLIALIAFAFAVGFCLVGRGLWRMQAWAWWVTVVCLVLSFVVDLAMFAEMSSAFVFVSGSTVVWTLFWTLVDLGMLVYLLMPEARAACGIDGQQARRPSQTSQRRLSQPALPSGRCANPACARVLEADWRHCPYCLTAVPGVQARAGLERLCTNPACGRRLQPQWRHCPYCLTALARA